jgi:hypothetical protein
MIRIGRRERTHLQSVASASLPVRKVATENLDAVTADRAIATRRGRQPVISLNVSTNPRPGDQLVVTSLRGLSWAMSLRIIVSLRCKSPREVTGPSSTVPIVQTASTLAGPYVARVNLVA